MGLDTESILRGQESPVYRHFIFAEVTETNTWREALHVSQMCCCSGATVALWLNMQL